MSIKRAITRPVIRSVVSDAIRADRRFVPDYDGVSAYSTMTAKVPLSRTVTIGFTFYRQSGTNGSRVFSGTDVTLAVRSSTGSPANSWALFFRDTSEVNRSLQFPTTLLSPPGTYGTGTLTIDLTSLVATLTVNGQTVTAAFTAGQLPKSLTVSGFGRETAGQGSANYFHGYIYGCWMKDVYRLQDRYVRTPDGVSTYGSFATPVTIPDGATWEVECSWIFSNSVINRIIGRTTTATASRLYIQTDGRATLQDNAGSTAASVTGAFVSGEHARLQFGYDGASHYLKKNGTVIASGLLSTSGWIFHQIHRQGNTVYGGGTGASYKITVNGVLLHSWALDESSGSTSVDTVGGNTLTWVNPTTPTYLAKFDSYWPGDEPSGTTIRDRCGVSDLTTVNVTRAEISV
jgi:hypothetical protein